MSVYGSFAKEGPSSNHLLEKIEVMNPGGRKSSNVVAASTYPEMVGHTLAVHKEEISGLVTENMVGTSSVSSRRRGVQGPDESRAKAATAVPRRGRTGRRERAEAGGRGSPYDQAKPRPGSAPVGPEGGMGLDLFAAGRESRAAQSSSSRAGHRPDIEKCSARRCEAQTKRLQRDVDRCSCRVLRDQGRHRASESGPRGRAFPS